MRSDQRESISQCDCCNSNNVKLIDESLITTSCFSKRSWPLVWWCEDCGARVGCHPKSNRPLGLMADSHTRFLRAKLHEKIDPLWQSGIASRDEIYAWLAKELQVEFEICHVSQLDTKNLRIALDLANKYYDLNVVRIQEAFRDKRYYKNRR